MRWEDEDAKQLSVPHGCSHLLIPFFTRKLIGDEKIYSAEVNSCTTREGAQLKEDFIIPPAPPRNSFFCRFHNCLLCLLNLSYSPSNDFPYQSCSVWLKLIMRIRILFVLQYLYFSVCIRQQDYILKEQAQFKLGLTKPVCLPFI